MFKIRIKESEKALVYKDEKLIKVLDTGVHKLFNPFGRYRVEIIDKKENGISGEKAKLLYKNFIEIVNQEFKIIELNDYERAFVKIDGKFTDFLPLGAVKLYFKELDLQVQKVDIRSNYQLNKEQADYIETMKILPSSVLKVYVREGEEAYLFRNGKYEKTLNSGVYYFFNELNTITVSQIDKRLKELSLNQQELLTKDKVTIRLNAVLHYKIADGLKFITEAEDADEYIYKQLQFAVREHIGNLEIDEVLQKQHRISGEIVQNFKKSLDGIGVELKNIHIKDIILPGEMREIFNKVIEAKKRAEANIIKRREETAATRSLLNTAKLMKDNPTLARLKELEALEKITQTVGTLNIYNGLDGVLNGMFKLK